MCKVEQANVDLFSSFPGSKSGKLPKVKFRDELISFEPELTDDDVNSIESDYVETKSDNQSPVIEYKTTIINTNSTVCNNDDLLDESLESEDEVIEDIVGEEEITTVKPKEEAKHANPKIGFIETFNKMESTKCSSKSSKRRKQPNIKYVVSPSEVHCKAHCIDKLECDLSMSIKKLEIRDKFQLPPLQLLQRKCCDEVKQKVPKPLPRYNGLRSEYGLSSRQLEKRERKKQILKIKEEMRHELMNEFKKRKMEQNEEVFSHWLKEVAKRRNEKQNTAKQIKPKETVTPNIITLPSKITGKTRERPRTANEFIPKTTVKKRKRPQTTQSCVYIEVPQSVLAKGLSLGNLVVTNSTLFSKNLHFLALS